MNLPSTYILKQQDIITKGWSYILALLCMTFLFSTNTYAQADKKAEAKGFLISNASKFGLSNEQAQLIIVSDAYESKGITHYYFQQTYQGLPVFNALMNVIILPKGESRMTATRFVKDLPKEESASIPTISPENAIENAAAHLRLTYLKKVSLKEVNKDAIAKGAFVSKYLFDKGDISTEDIQVELVWVKDIENQVHLAWNILIHEVSLKDVWNVRVDAITGVVIEKNSYVAHCDWGNHTEDADHLVLHNEIDKVEGELSNLVTGDYNIFDTPFESPLSGARTVVNAPWTRAGGGNNATSLQWHNDGSTTYTITRGNNVWAKEDQAADNEFTIGASASSGTSDFNFPFSGSITNPVLDQDAAITNLFFWNNLNHDILYQYGFDEVSGNFQNDNQGRGGLGVDYVNADALDGAGFNNANFSTPPDGTNPRMQMFIWRYNTALSISSVPLSTSALGTANFGPQNFNVTANLIVADDGVGMTTDACEPLINSVAGKIVIIDRNVCTIVNKVANAQAGGAVGVIIVQNNPGPATNMTGSNPSITIPCLMVSTADGNTLKTAVLGGPVSLNMFRTTHAATSDFDNAVITHEYGHGVSNRLTGGPANSNCLNNAEQMGEGWSDYLGLMLTTNWATAGMNDLRPVGSYVAGGGIRDYPYTYNIAASPYDYNFARTFTEVHRTGSVWCAMLWDMTWNIIAMTPASTDMYHGTGGNNIALQLVMEGMKLQPCQPGFVDGRDAILLADEILYNGIHTCAIWNAFARRGLGFSASQGSSLDMSDGSQATDLPPALSINLNGDELTLFTNESATYTTTITCGCFGTQNNVIPTVTIPSGLTHQSGGTFSAGQVTFPSTNFVQGQTQSYSFTASVNNTATMPTVIFMDEVEGAAQFTANQLLGSFPLFATTAIAPVYGNNSWEVDEPALPSDRDLVLNTPITIPSVGYSLHFTHEHTIEAGYDGGLVEFSVDTGATWTDASALFTQNGYNGTIDPNTDNTLINRNVFTGASNGIKESIITLDSFAGQNMIFRFRFGTDTGNGSNGNATMPGWKIDRIWIGTSAACLTLTADAMQSNVSQASASICQNLAPAATALSIVCPPNITLNNCGGVVNYPAIIPTNGEGGNTVTFNPPSGSTFSTGVTNVVAKVTDAVGHTATCNFNVITGGPAPTITSSPAAVAGVVTVCNGAGVTLTGSSADEYLWYKNGVAVNYALTPNYTVTSNSSTDVYTLAVANTGLLCLSAQSAPITIVSSSPAATITPSGPTAFCANNPTTLNANTGAGLNYVWKRGSTVVGTNASSYIPSVSGNHNVTVTNGNGCSKTSGWLNITVKAIPIANAGNDISVCTNQSAVIGSTPNALLSYIWSPTTNLSNPNIANPTVSPTTTTSINYTVTVNNPSTNCSNTDIVSVIGLDIPSAPTLNSTTTPVCQGSTVSLTAANTIGATSIQWYRNGSVIYNQSPAFVTVVSLPTVVADVYAIKSKNASGCFSALSNNVSVLINAAPVPTITSSPNAVGNVITVCVPGGTSGTANLTANVPGGSPSVTYSWQQLISNVYTNVAAGSNYIANVTTSANNKNFVVQATYSNGCIKTSTNRLVKLVTSGCVPRIGSGKDDDLTEIVLESDILTAYPNPTEGLLNVNIENCQASEGKLVLYNALGQIVAERSIIIINGKGNDTLDLSELAIGVYSLSFQSNELQKVVKVVKE